MASTLTELCKHLQTCTETLESEIKRNIDDCHKLLLSNEATEIKLALEKAKDYHYKEILDIIRAIVTNIRKIIVHEEKIRTLSDENNLSHEELKRYSHVQRQINAFSHNAEYAIKREKRRVASEISIGSLEAWEQYLEKKSEDEKAVEVEKSEIGKRKRINSRRRKKKFVSSTFNNFLDDGNGARKLDSILEGDFQEDDLNPNDRLLDEDGTSLESDESLNMYDNTSLKVNDTDTCRGYLEEVLRDPGNTIIGSDSKGEGDKENLEQYSVPEVVETINKELCLGDPDDDKPRIVDVVYKKRTN